MLSVSYISSPPNWKSCISMLKWSWQKFRCIKSTRNNISNRFMTLLAMLDNSKLVHLWFCFIFFINPPFWSRISPIYGVMPLFSKNSTEFLGKAFDLILFLYRTWRCLVYGENTQEYWESFKNAPDWKGNFSLHIPRWAVRTYQWSSMNLTPPIRPIRLTK